MKTIRSLVLSVLMTGALAISAQSITEPTQYYLIHSGGSHLCKGDDGRGRLESVDADAPQIMTFAPASNGYCTIAAPDGTYLSLEGTWSTIFGSDNSSNKAFFKIEPIGGGLVKIRNGNNGKFLGTDSAQPGSAVYSDKSGDGTNHVWMLATEVDAEIPAQASSYVINPGARRQTIEGWGVSLCWWANMCGKWDDDKIDEIVDWLVSPDGLNFNIFRYNIGGGDDPDNAHCTAHHMGNGKGLRAEMEGFKDSSDGPYIWTRDEAQRKIMLKIKEKRPDAVFEAFSNSAPWYMTYSGCCAGNTNSGTDNLKPEYYEEFAHYLVDVCKHYKDEYGIEFLTLDPFNEPMTSYWGANGGQEGCHFDVQSMINFIKVLSPILKESGLRTMISAADETSVGQSVADFEAFESAGIMDMIGQFNTHTYTVSDKDRARLSALCRGKGMRLWMSEVGAGGSGLEGNLNMAKKLMNDVRHIMPLAWIDWQYIEEGNDQWCLVKSTAKFEAQQYARVKNYYVRSHFSRYFTVGTTMLTTLDNNVLAGINAAGDQLTVVALNTGLAPVDHTVDLSMFASVETPSDAVITDQLRDMDDYLDEVAVADGTLSFRVPAQAIVTIVVPVSADVASTTVPVAGESYLIVPRLGNNVALSTVDGLVAIKNVTLDDAQLWQLSGTLDKCSFTNGDGEIITRDGDSYFLTTSDTANDNQYFKLEALDAPYYNISTLDGAKSFDLEGEGTGAGTKVGMWAFGDVKATHRQWAFFKVPDAAGSGIELPSADASEISATIDTLTPGVLTIVNPGDVKTDALVYDASGRCIYGRTLTDGTTSIPMPGRFYIVALRTAATTAATTAAVKVIVR